MSLSDRLQKARTNQLIAEGLLPDDHDVEATAEVEEAAVEVTPATPGDAHGLFAPITIEARPVGLHLVAEPGTGVTELADDEQSTSCPNCNAAGLVDMVDLVGHTVHYTCTSCSTMWQVRKAVVSDSVLP